MARVIRARPPRPAVVRSLARWGVVRSLARWRDPSVAASAATTALAVALVVATSVALAGLQLQPDARGADRPGSPQRPGGEPADPGLTATPTTLVWTTPVPSASVPASHHRLAGTTRRSAVARPATPAHGHELGSRGPVRTRAQRWFARRNLEGG